MELHAFQHSLTFGNIKNWWGPPNIRSRFQNYPDLDYWDRGSIWISDKTLIWEQTFLPIIPLYLPPSAAHHPLPFISANSLHFDHHHNTTLTPSRQHQQDHKNLFDSSTESPTQSRSLARTLINQIKTYFLTKSKTSEDREGIYRRVCAVVAPENRGGYGCWHHFAFSLFLLALLFWSFNPFGTKE